MEAPPCSSSSSSSCLPPQNHTDYSLSDPSRNHTVENVPALLPAITKRNQTRTKPQSDRNKDASSIGAKSSSSGSTASICSSSRREGRVRFRFRRPRIRLGSTRREPRGEVAIAAFPLGMSFALVINKVLEEQDTKNRKISIDYLAEVCTLAVRESLAYAFGDQLDCFVKNFEKSFGCTLRALRPITESSALSGTWSAKHHNRKTTRFRGLIRRPVGCPSSKIKGSDSEFDSSNTVVGSQSDTHGESVATDSLNQELTLYQRVNHLACVIPSASSALDESIVSTVERSLVQQVRANDLKELELRLMMERVKLAETHVVLNADSNHLKRSELRMDESRASFKAEKFKNEVEVFRHAELQRKCIDCLVAGLFIMVFFLLYGVYTFSYRRLTDATSACSILPEKSMSWSSWYIPKEVSSVNSGLKTLKCQVQVISQMLFGILMILAVAFLVVQRSSSNQTMPISFTILLLGIVCGFAGKISIDTLGGSGKHWFFYWEILCLLHFLSTAWTSALFLILHGPVNVYQTTRYSSRLLPYWLRRLFFYSAVLLILPFLSALTPFATLVEWRDHFKQLAVDYFSHAE